MALGTRNLLDEHLKLSRAWLSAEQARVDLLQRLLGDHLGRCTADYPDGLFDEYEEALTQASLASRAYAQWLAEQGIQSK